MKVSGRPYGEANTALIKIKIKLKPENDPTYELVTLLTDLVIASSGLYYSLCSSIPDLKVKGRA